MLELLLASRAGEAGPRLYSLRRAARVLGVDRERLARWVQDGRVRAVEIDGALRIAASELGRIERDGVPTASSRRRALRRVQRSGAANEPMSEQEIRAQLDEF